ncbi:transporter [Rhizocola hellebori]|uniref:Transporter n=1 Tax=Rhizocola hellebori TaxID=1392758 RepID=A0A8J3VFK5_9ACTN|nr:ABC transporter permease [Rhizocola hellebori]GIH03973.1 transporter [Rhizocola hellebori]
MIWLTWRQFRASASAVFGVLGAVALALAITGPNLYREYDALLTRCARTCIGDAYDHFFFPHVGAYFGLILLVTVLPVVVGMFWGAPLIGREFETGTHDLVWQQSVSRRRWLAVKLGLVGLATIAAAALTVVAVSWWSHPLDATAITGLNRMTPIVFDARGIVVIGHSAFALTLGAAAGLLLRRTLPAMAVTFAVLVAVLILVPTFVRPHLAAPERLESAITTNERVGGLDLAEDGTIRGLLVDLGPPGAWMLGNETVDATGHAVVALPAWAAGCAPPDSPMGEAVQQQCLQRLAAEGYRQSVTYHPAERFWLFQAYETVIFAIVSLLLAWFCFVWIRPR